MINMEIFFVDAVYDRLKGVLPLWTTDEENWTHFLSNKKSWKKRFELSFDEKMKKMIL